MPASASTEVNLLAQLVPVTNLDHYIVPAGAVQVSSPDAITGPTASGDTLATLSTAPSSLGGSLTSVPSTSTLDPAADYSKLSGLTITTSTPNLNGAGSTVADLSASLVATSAVLPATALSHELSLQGGASADPAGTTGPFSSSDASAFLKGLPAGVIANATGNTGEPQVPGASNSSTAPIIDLLSDPTGISGTSATDVQKVGLQAEGSNTPSSDNPSNTSLAESISADGQVAVPTDGPSNPTGDGTGPSDTSSPDGASGASADDFGGTEQGQTDDFSNPPTDSSTDTSSDSSSDAGATDISGPPSLEGDASRKVVDAVGDAAAAASAQTSGDPSSTATDPGATGQEGDGTAGPNPAGTGSSASDTGGPAAPVPTPQAQLTSGGYVRHYTRTGSNSDAEFYLEVTIDSTFGAGDAAAPGNAAAPRETGTVTYTAWLKVLGSYVYDETNVVVPFNSPTSNAAGPTFFGLTPGGGASQYETSSFSFDAFTWDHQHWSESVTFSARGAVSSDGGSGDQVSVQSTMSYWEDIDRTWTPPDNGAGEVTPLGASMREGAGTEIDTDQYAGSYRTDVITSDNADSFRTDTQYDDKGYPTDLFNDPVAGSTFLARSFDSGSYKGTTNNTIEQDANGDPVRQQSREISSYKGASGYRFHFGNSPGPADAPGAAGTPADAPSLLVDYQQTSTYGGSVDKDLGSTDPLVLTGTSTITSHNSGSVSVNTVEMTVPYHTTEGGVRRDGTLRVRSSNTGSYDNSESQHQTYDDNGHVSADELTYRYESSSDSKFSTSDLGSFGFNVSGMDGTQAGQTTGGQYTSTSVTSHAEGHSSGTSDRLDKTGSVDMGGSYSGSSSSLALVNGHYAANGQSGGAADTVAFSSASSSYSGDFRVNGGYNSDGLQTDGTNNSHSESSGSGKGWVWSKVVGNDVATTTSLVTFTSSSSTDATADLWYEDAKANGSLDATASTSRDQDTTVTVKGPQRVSDGSTTVNDRNHRHSYSDNATAAHLQLAAGLSAGTVKIGAAIGTSYDYKLDRKFDQDSNKSHAKFDADGAGTVGTSDTVTSTYAAGTPTISRTVFFKQKGHNSVTLSANGTLSGDTGHSGSWKLKSSASGNVDDSLTVTLVPQGSAWTENDRQFFQSRRSGSESSLHEEDNGLGLPASTPDVTYTRKHVLDTMTSRSSESVEDGQATNYKFKREQTGLQKVTESASGSWSNTAHGEGGNFASETLSVRGLKDTHIGFGYKGGEYEKRIDTDRLVLNASKWDSMNYSRQVQNDSHSRHFYRMTEYLIGNTNRGTISRDVETNDRAWMWTLDKSTGQWTSMGDVDPKPDTVISTDHSWPEEPKPQPNGILYWLAQGFNTDPGMDWLRQNGGSALQIVGGAIDVGLGLGFTLGTAGLAVVPGVGLMAVGIDQIFTGVANIGSGQQGPSVFQYAGYTGAQGLGLSQGTSQVVGAFTPLALSLAFLGGALALTPGGAGSAPSLVHLTDDLGKAGILNSGQIVGARGIFAVPAAVADETALWKLLRTGLLPGRTANAIPIPEAAAGLFSRPVPLGPFSGWLYLGGTRYAPAGAINLATGAFSASPSLIGPATLIYGADGAIYLGTASGVVGISEFTK